MPHGAADATALQEVVVTIIVDMLRYIARVQEDLNGPSGPPKSTRPPREVAHRACHRSVSVKSLREREVVREVAQRACRSEGVKSLVKSLREREVAREVAQRA